MVGSCLRDVLISFDFAVKLPKHDRKGQRAVGGGAQDSDAVGNDERALRRTVRARALRGREPPTVFARELDSIGGELLKINQGHPSRPRSRLSVLVVVQG